MKINELFTTLPGILIISGVVLLVLAIVLFILGNKKAKKEAKNVENKIVDEVKEDMITENTAVETANKPVTITEPEVTPAVEETVVPVVEQTMEPTAPVVDIPTVEPVVVSEPVVETPVEINAEPVVEIPAVEQTIEPTAPVVDIPAVEPVVVSEPETVTISEPTEPAPFTMPDIAPITIEETKVEEAPAYGGVEPAATIPAVEEPAPTIYGGADPLEKTQTMPAVEENHEPYGGTPEVKIVEPTYEFPTSAPTTIETPEPIKLEEPEQL